MDNTELGALSWLVELPYVWQHRLLVAVQAVLSLCVLGLLGLGGAALRGWRLPSEPRERRYVLALLGVLALAVAVRLGVPPDAPEIRWRLRWSYMPWGEVHGYTDLHKYGAGMPFLTWLVVLFEGGSQRGVLGLTTALSAATTLPLAGLARGLAGSRVVGVAAAVCFALAPLPVRFARVDSPFAADHFFAVLTLYGVWRVAEGAASDTGGWRRWLVAAALSAVIAAQLRVESALVVAEALTLAALAGGRFPWRARETVMTFAAGLVLAIPHLLLVVPQLVFEFGYRFEGPPRKWYDEGEVCLTALNPEVSGWPLVVLWPLGALVGPAPWRVRVWALGWAAVNLSLDPSICPRSFAFSVVRYQLRAQPWVLLLAGLGLAALVGAPGRTALARARWALGALVVAGAAWAVVRVAGPDTVLAREHAFLMTNLPRVPDGCRVYTHVPDNDAMLVIEGGQSRMLGLDHTWVNLDGFVVERGRGDAHSDGDCVVYYQAAACSTAYDQATQALRYQVCEVLEAALQPYLTPLATGSLVPDPRSPMGGRLVHPEPIPIGLYRVAPGAPLPRPEDEPPPRGAAAEDAAPSPPG